MLQRIAGSSSLVFALLAASTAYLISLLAGYVFDFGNVKRHHIESASYLFAMAALVAAFVRSGRSTWDSRDLRSPESGWLPFVFIVAAVILYGNTIQLGMFSDDFVLAQKALAGEWLPQESLVRPVPIVVWRLLLAATHSPSALHLLNICLHGLNAALVAFLAGRAGLPRTPSIAAGVLFLVFPSSVEAVAWPAAVHDLIVAACALTFLLLAAQPVNAARLSVAAIVLIVGLLSKESAIVIPFLAIALWLDVRSPHRTRALRILLGGVMVCAVYLAFRMALVPMPDSYAKAPTRYVIKELLARPVATLALPWTTAVFDSWPVIPFFWSLTWIAVVASYAWRTNKVAAPLAIGRFLVAAIVTVLPLYSILFITPDLENGRYLYLSTAFWVIALIGMATVPGRSTPALRLVFIAVIGVGVVGVQVHLASWREAARVRQRVLVAARHLLEVTPCAAVSLGGAPDNVRGAFVFRNGLSEAVAFRTNARPAPSPAGTDCVFVWNGSAFERTTDSSIAVQASFLRQPR